MHNRIRESIDDAEMNENDPLTDDEEFYDSLSSTEEPVNNEEMHERDPVDLLEVKFHHKNQAAISQKTHNGVSRKKSLIKSDSTNKEFINSVTDEEEISDLHSGKKEPIESNDLLLIEESIENRSHDIMDQDGKAHVYMMGNQIEIKEYYSA